jgi:GntR family transcriptional regulator
VVTHKHHQSQEDAPETSTIIPNGADSANVGDQVSVQGDGYVAAVTINQFNPEPLYRQLAAIIRGQIQAGKLGHLDRLPSEAWYVQEHGVSRDTVRKTIEVLRDEGLVFTLGQRGTFVGPKPDD